MKIVLSILFGTVALAESFRVIPFDWSGQFGYINDGGAIFWNSDWRSNRLLFDGTWAIYPRMYGSEIEDGFKFDNSNTFNGKDSISIDSYFKYDQGDYLLDRFSFTVNYGMQGRRAKLHAFKRTYAGSFNQYSNASLQPQQQSYLFTYESSKGRDDGGFSLGHFNTYSGFPDSTVASIIDSRITTSNIFWKRKGERLITIFMIDHFLQRYETDHSLSFFSNSRYLTRSRYQFEALFPIYDYDATLHFSNNIRSIKTNMLTITQWNNCLLKFGKDHTNISLGLFHIEDQFYIEQNLNFGKTIGQITADINYNLDYRPVHPYFMIKTFEPPIENSVLLKSVSGSLAIKLSKSKISSTLSHLIDENELWDLIKDDALAYDASYRMIDFYYQTNIIPFLDVEMNYIVQKRERAGVYSGGIGKWFELKFKSNFNIFHENMLIDINGEIKHLRDRIAKSNLNPIEMVPNVNPKSYDGSLEPINIINASITAQVSKFIISYEWYNISELVLGSIGSEKNNYFTIHPDMPDLGRQVNLSITWLFQD